MLGLRLFPYSKVIRSALVALPVQLARALESIVEIAPRKHSVMMFLIIFTHIEIHRAVGFIGIARFEDFFHTLDLLQYVTARTRLY